jgi:isopenicillin-N epimerase
LLSGHLHHPIVSHSYSKGLFAECAMLGTKDYSAMLTVPAGLAYFDRLGGLQKVIERNQTLCWKVLTFLGESWGTLDQRQPKLLTSSMGMIGLPVLFGDSWAASDEVRLELRNRYRIVVQRPFPIEGDRLHLRVSVAVYNSWSEFVALRDAVLEMAEARRVSELVVT